MTFNYSHSNPAGVNATTSQFKIDLGHAFISLFILLLFYYSLCIARDSLLLMIQCNDATACHTHKPYLLMKIPNNRRIKKSHRIFLFKPTIKRFLGVLYSMMSWFHDVTQYLSYKLVINITKFAMSEII